MNDEICIYVLKKIKQILPYDKTIYAALDYAIEQCTNLPVTKREFKAGEWYWDSQLDVWTHVYGREGVLSHKFIEGRYYKKQIKRQNPKKSFFGIQIHYNASGRHVSARDQNGWLRG